MADAGDEEGMMEEGAKETFHIYILSFAYGTLAVLIAGHLLWRWQWRRRMLSRVRSSVPGDNSFKHKRLQQRLKDDFSSIKSLSCDPRLVNPDFSSQQFGGCDAGSDFPTHWYRMKAFDTAADLVSSQLHLLRDPPRDLSLPGFLSALHHAGSGTVTLSSVVERCQQLYTRARYQDEVFSETDLNEFQSLIHQLKQLLSAEGQPSQPSSAPAADDPRARHRPLTPTSSREPLLSSSPDRAGRTSSPDNVVARAERPRAPSWSRQKEEKIELSPLLTYEMEPRASSPTQLSPRPCSPETPV